MNHSRSLDKKNFWALLRRTEDHGLECLSVLGAHEVVEDGVEGGGEVVEAAREIHEILIDSPVEMTVLEVDISKPLYVERSPGNEEQDNDRN